MLRARLLSDVCNSGRRRSLQSALLNKTKLKIGASLCLGWRLRCGRLLACAFVTETRNEFSHGSKCHRDQKSIHERRAEHTADDDGSKSAARDGARTSSEPQRHTTE